MKKNLSNNSLVVEIKSLIEQSKQQLAVTVNATLSLLYWQIGKRINDEILQNQRAEYGKAVIENLSNQLTLNYGSGWSKKQLFHCLYVVETFPDLEKFSTVCRQLSWSHIKIIMYVNDPLKREFYIEMCKLENWSVRVFQERIQSMLYERTAISKKPELTIQQDLELLKNEQKLSPDLVFKDPYVLDFLGLKDAFSEKDLETSIIAELQRFIIELGTDFAFLARQKRITIDTTDYYIDLLFYHRRLKCLVAIDLKIGNFDAAHKGQMELYLRYLEKYEQVEGENSPIGLILCSGKNNEHVELLQLDKRNIRVADYLTLLPSEEVLKQKLHQAIEIAKSRIDSRN
ncbi:MAG: DUF1016 domain-containing protein [Flavobacteriales bacterium]|nr:DUF1016 domain-containing protein [Flavobacteriales bacterium]